ncbi:hypothetical protein V6N12_054424 [Hibiscus sabdariffa]|uniref:Uncharacterized protein n=1 Tax=Hibiscus sabdariffa TaxID=183260 RepID=A0ABR2D0C8_9ROSI
MVWKAKDCIFSFNLGVEQFVKILMDDIFCGQNAYFCSNMGIMGGKLCVTRIHWVGFTTVLKVVWNCAPNFYNVMAYLKSSVSFYPHSFLDDSNITCQPVSTLQGSSEKKTPGIATFPKGFEEYGDFGRKIVLSDSTTRFTTVVKAI